MGEEAETSSVIDFTTQAGSRCGRRGGRMPAVQGRRVVAGAGLSWLQPVDQKRGARLSRCPSTFPFLDIIFSTDLEMPF